MLWKNDRRSFVFYVMENGRRSIFVCYGKMTGGQHYSIAYTVLFSYLVISILDTNWGFYTSTVRVQYYNITISITIPKPPPGLPKPFTTKTPPDHQNHYQDHQHHHQDHPLLVMRPPTSIEGLRVKGTP